ncbi:MAG: adenylyltransferase/cytidyltransferase family protein [Candidatus Colwellbacteria bacterium]|nr:adenylyltransferase/cytidyltransferase family protein [Candidatus Colwellbacteria bacterium]
MGDRRRNKKEVVVTVSGGFDPVHVGHVRLFEEAKKLGDKLVVILNNDHWLMKKKGYVFMPQRERKELIEALEAVDKVVISSHKPNPKDMSVSKDLGKLRPHVFANGGDRNKKDSANPKSSLYRDIQICRRLGIKLVFNIGRGGKVQSSSWLLNAFLNNSSGRDRKE